MKKATTALLGCVPLLALLKLSSAVYPGQLHILTSINRMIFVPNYAMAPDTAIQLTNSNNVNYCMCKRECQIRGTECRAFSYDPATSTCLVSPDVRAALSTPGARFTLYLHDLGIKKEADGLFYLLPADKKYSFDGITECEKLGLRLAQPKTRVSMDVAKQYNADAGGGTMYMDMWSRTWGGPITWGRNTTEIVDASLFAGGEPNRITSATKFESEGTYFIYNGHIQGTFKTQSRSYLCQGNLDNIEY